jgi:hypothetical protein
MRSLTKGDASASSPSFGGASGDLGSLHLDRRAIVSVDLAKKVSLWNGGNVQVKAISRYH